jgi:methionyl-tRNA formyltransferase
MKVGFFGTPELAARCLSELHDKHDIRFAVTAADKESGRNRQVQFSPVKHEALKLGIPVLQPAKLTDPSFLDSISKYNADVYIVVAYGNLVPRSVYELPPLKTVNLHPSLLPLYRGAAPIQWALINGERETGLTVQLINERLDAGDIIEQEVIPVDDDMTAGDLFRMVYSRGPGLLDRAIQSLSSANPRLVRQDESRATYCRKIDRSTARIDWGMTPHAIHNLVRGLNPKPGAFSSFRGQEIKIWKTRLVSDDIPGRTTPGVLIRYQKKRLLAVTGGGLIEICLIQPANKKIMDGLSFINGYRISQDDRFD